MKTLQIVLTAVALVLVLEGVIPFLSPNLWRQILTRITMMPDQKIRMIGLISLLCGTLLMILVHSGWL